MSADVRAQRWVFTINNPTVQVTAKAKEFIESTRVILGVCENEVGSQGTPHIQGFFVTDKVYHRSSIEVWLGATAYLAPAQGSRKQNYLYCTKEGPDHLIISKGFNYQTSELDKTDAGFAVIHDDLKKKSPKEFEEDHPMFFFFHRSQCLSAMVDFQQQQNIWDGNLAQKNYWCWGKPGTGKTLWSYRIAEGHHMYRKAVNKWWDGFDPWKFDVVLIDEWPAANTAKEGVTNGLCSLLKNWSDRYSFIGEVKGGHVNIYPGRFIVIVTSQYPIEECFINNADIMALKRRFHEMEFRFQPHREHPSYINTFDDMAMYEHGELIESMRSVPFEILK